MGFNSAFKGLSVGNMEILGVLFVSEETFSLVWDFAVTLVSCIMLQEEIFSKTCLTQGTFCILHILKTKIFK
jgi:hypothetical protein